MVTIPFEIVDTVAEGGDPELVAALLAGYREYLTQQMGALKSAALQQRTKEVHRIAHAIRGGALTIRADGLARCAKKLERAASTGNCAMIDALVSQLSARVDEVLPDTSGAAET